MSYQFKRVTLLAGHYGSGKTNIAVNMAFELKNRVEKVTVADLDIVNPYFRTKDSQKDFENAGIRFISSQYANTNLDIPALPTELYSVTDDKSSYAIMDIGGDDRGALALGRYAPAIKEENNYEMLLVINKFRPLTPDAKSVIEVMREIEIAGKIPFTGIVNNSNLGKETTAEDILSSLSFADEVSSLTGLPVRFTSVADRLYSQLEGKIENLFPLKLQNTINSII